MTDEQRERVDINWVQVSASALAAVTSAVLLSTVGVAGTIIGAAIGSLIATAGSAIYQHYLRLTKDRVVLAQELALQRVARARVSVGGAGEDVRRARAHDLHTRAQRAEKQVEQADDELAQAEQELRGAGTERPSWREVLAGLPWKRIAAVTAGIFVAAMLVILAFELLTGRAVSSYTGGSDDRRTSIPGVGSTAAETTPAPQEQQQDDAPSDVPTDQPTSEPTIDEQPSEAGTVEPSETPSIAPSEAPTPLDPTGPEPSQTPIPTPPVQTGPTG